VRRKARPVVITNAERSQDDQLHSREVRYLLMMSFRALCLVAAAALVGAHAPLLWVWIPICLFGMVVVPWLAVILANDRPPKKRQKRVAARQPPAAEALPEPLAIEPVRIIDADQ
jgi:Flp pilus assembly protein TadB